MAKRTKPAPELATSSLASLYADPSKGWRAVPRWFRSTDFWRGLPAAHRAVLDELYQRVAHEPLVQKGSGIKLDRGQWAISWQALAKSSGASVQQARAAIGKAVSNKVVQQGVTAFRTPTSTEPRCVFTWLDFESYDIADDDASKTLNKSPNKASNSTTNIASNSISTLSPTTHSQMTLSDDTTDTTQPGEGAAAPRDVGLPASAPLSDASTASTANPKDSQEQSIEAAQAQSGDDRKTPPPTKLTPEAAAWICASIENMTSYLLYGLPAVWAESTVGLPPTKSNWRVAANAEGPNPEGWSTGHFVSFYWFRVCRYRETMKLPLTLPGKDWARIGKGVDNLLVKLGGKTAMFQFIDALTAYFDLVRYQLGGSFGWSQVLDETTLNNAKVIGAVHTIRSMDEATKAQVGQAAQTWIESSAA